MLDPMSLLMFDLLEMMDQPEVDIADILLNYTTIGNVNLNRAGPAGLQIVDAQWK